MIDWMDSITNSIGFIILWAATDVGRKSDSKIKVFGGKWWLIAALLATGAIIIGL